MKKKFYLWTVVVLTGMITLSGCGRFTSFGKGKSLFKEGDYRGAQKEFEKVVEAEPNTHNGYLAYVYLARIAGINGDYTQGVSFCEKAISIFPKSPEAHYLSIILYQLNGQMGKATHAWDKVSNMPQFGKGFALMAVNPPASGKLRPEKIASLRELLK